MRYWLVMPAAGVANVPDAGKIVGRQGRTVAALRMLAASAGEREGKTVTLEVRNAPYKG